MTSRTQIANQTVSNSSAINSYQEVGGVGVWLGAPSETNFSPLTATTIEASVRSATRVIFDSKTKRLGIAGEGEISSDAVTKELQSGDQQYPLMGILPPLYPEWLGDRGFQETHGLRFAYVGGAMARGIASARIVIELGKMGAMGMFGAAGLSPAVVESALTEISDALNPLALPWGSNLIHSPNEPDLENQIIDLYLRLSVKRVSASAFMSLTPAIVRYACVGLSRAADGTIHRENYVFAKISREEVARHFISPAPQKILDQLLAEGKISPEEAEIAATIPLSEDIIVESDSGGHTDNRPLNALFSAISSLRDNLSQEFAYSRPIRLGAAGSLGTPLSVAAAYSLGAAFVLVGTVHQAAIESGVSDNSRKLLAKAELADVAMAIPVGVGAAIYLEEYGTSKRLDGFIELNIANLAGVPSVIYGLLGLELFVRIFGMGNSVLAGGCTLALLVLPIVIIATREALRTVPYGLREAALGLGATRWQVVRRVVLPMALPGILTGAILSVSRAIGETAPLILVGAVVFITFAPEGLDSQFTALPIQIFNWVSMPQKGFMENAAAGILVLLLTLLTINLVAILLRNHFQRRNAN